MPTFDSSSSQLGRSEVDLLRDQTRGAECVVVQAAISEPVSA